MPWHTAKTAQCPVSKPWGVIKDSDGSVSGCHATEESAQKQVAALYANEGGNMRSVLDEYDQPGALPDTQYRSFAPDLEVRSSGDGRTIFGIAVPWDAPARVDHNLVESFLRGAFNHQLNAPNRVKFENEHVELGGTLIGAASLLRNDPAGLYVELRAARTLKGDETLELVKDGALDQLSVAFNERQNRRMGPGIVQRVKAHLKSIAITRQGAYGDLAMAAGVRSAQLPNAAVDLDLRFAVEEYLHLPDLPDHDLEIRKIKLGMPWR